MFTKKMILNKLHNLVSALNVWPKMINELYKRFGVLIQSNINIKSSFWYTWRFIIADVTQPIIGGDFLRSHCLLVDLANERLIRSDNLKTIKGARSTHESFKITAITSTNEFSRLLDDRPQLTTPTFSFDLPKHGVQHRIPTTGFPVHSQARCLSPKKLKMAIFKEFLERSGGCKHSPD